MYFIPIKFIEKHNLFACKSLSCGIVLQRKLMMSELIALIVPCKTTKYTHTSPFYTMNNI